MGGKFKVTFNFAGLNLYIADLFTDISLALLYYQNGDIVWFSHTLTFILLALIVSSIFAMYGVHDNDYYGILSNKYVYSFLGLTLTLPFVLMVWGFVDLCKGKDNDRTLVSQVMKLLEVILEALFQTCLQAYIICHLLSTDGNIDAWQWITLSVSIANLAFSVPISFMFESKSYSTKITFFFLEGISIVSRLIVCSLFSFVYKPMWLLPICTELTAMIMIWLIKKYCKCESSEPLDDVHNNTDPFAMLLVVLICIINTVYNTFTSSGIIISGINLAFAIGSWFLIPETMAILCIIGISLSAINFVVNIIIVVCPPLQLIGSDWLNAGFTGDEHLFF